MTLFGIALSIGAKSMIELGVAGGDSTYPLLLAANILNTKLVSVDIGPCHFDCPKDLKGNWEFVQSDAITFLEKWDRGIDLIFVDDWHSYSHVKRELEIIDGYTTKSSIILLHDLMTVTWPEYNYTTPETLPNTAGPGQEFADGGPYRAVNELDKGKWEWATIPVNHGLTILRKK
jgi:predicted O-methyltransferase YrrM